MSTYKPTHQIQRFYQRLFIIFVYADIDEHWKVTYILVFPRLRTFKFTIKYGYSPQNSQVHGQA